MSQGERDQIEMMLNFDIVGWPNFVRFVYDGDNSSFPAGPGAARGPAGSDTIEAATFGGTAGQQYDPCYHLACDTFSRTDTKLALTGLDQMSDAVAHAVLLFSRRNFDKQPLAAPAPALSARSAITNDLTHDHESELEAK